MKICSKCGMPLRPETEEGLRDEYPYYCPTCDENMYEFEAIEKEESSYFAELEKNVFWSPFEQMMHKNGKHFKVLRQLDETEVDEIDTGNFIFKIMFEDGEEGEAFLEELNEDYKYGRAAYIGTLAPVEKR